MKISKNLLKALEYVGIELPICSYELEETSRIMEEVLQDQHLDECIVLMLSKACAELEHMAEILVIKEMEDAVIAL